MSEKVLIKKILNEVAKEIYGFPSWEEFADEQGTDMPNELYTIIELTLRLAQDKAPAVSLQALKEKCKSYEGNDLNKFFTNRDAYHVEYGRKEAAREILSWAEKQASKKGR